MRNDGPVDDSKTYDYIKVWSLYRTIPYHNHLKIRPTISKEKKMKDDE